MCVWLLQVVNFCSRYVLFAEPSANEYALVTSSGIFSCLSLTRYLFGELQAFDVEVSTLQITIL